MSYAYRRHLPHYQNDFRTYFVTFVTRGRKVLPGRARDIVLARIVNSPLAYLHVAVVMPDHVHLLATPTWDKSHMSHPIAEIVRRIKGASAREVNLAFGTTGPLWQEESFDHQLRNDESLIQKADYIANNPVRKGLVARPEDYPWLWRRTS